MNTELTLRRGKRAVFCANPEEPVTVRVPKAYARIGRNRIGAYIRHVRDCGISWYSLNPNNPSIQVSARSRGRYEGSLTFRETEGVSFDDKSSPRIHTFYYALVVG